MRIIRLVSKLKDIDKWERESHKLNKTKFNISEHIQKIICNFETHILNQGKHHGVTAGKDVTSLFVHKGTIKARTNNYEINICL